jgi:hypothetical protein
VPSVRAEPYELVFQPEHVGLVDMQRDFVDPGVFREALGDDVSLLRKVVRATARVLAAAREAGILVIRAREGHRPDLALTREASDGGDRLVLADCVVSYFPEFQRAALEMIKAQGHLWLGWKFRRSPAAAPGG